MKEWISNQVELHFAVDGEEKMKKQTISNIIQTQLKVTYSPMLV